MRSLPCVLLALAACAPETTSSPDGASTGDGGNGGTTGRVYASTQDELFELDPVTKALRLVGRYDCIRLTPNIGDSQDGMADIAVDKDLKMYGVGRVSDANDWALVSIDPATAKCTTIAPVDVSTMYPCGLSFVPAGTIHPTSEVLVGITVDGRYLRFDLTTGASMPVGGLGTGTGFLSKGADLVSIIGGKTYTTGQGSPDVLYELNTNTGMVTRTVGMAGSELIAGLGFWGGTLYAFDYEGRLWALDANTAAATQIPIPNAPVGLRFWGAAVTTAAPLVIL